MLKKIFNYSLPFNLPSQLAAFKHRNYRLFFFGQAISLTGTWLQSIALSWLLIQLTNVDNRPLILGINGAIGAAPIFLFSLPAGSIIDKLNKRNIIIATQMMSMILAFILAILTHLNIITIHLIYLLGFLLGTVNALDAPTRQSFVVEMVGKEDLSNAIALNSAMFNGARIVGPAVAGLVIAAIGVSGTFAVNGISFIAVIIGLLMMNVKPVRSKKSTNGMDGMKEGFNYIKSNKLIKSLLLMIAVLSIFASSYLILVPIFANDILKLGAKEFGYLMTSIGIGALIGAITLSSVCDYPYKGRILLTGIMTYCVMLILFSYSRNFYLCVILLIFAGWGMTTSTALINTMIQLNVQDNFRGRVMSFHSMMFIGMVPIGSLQIGFCANWFSTPAAIRISSIICIALTFILAPAFFNHVEENDIKKAS